MPAFGESTRKSFRGVYIMNAIYALAGSFVGIFVPIYLLQKNLNTANVFGFYLVYAIGVPFFFLLAHKIARTIGLRKTVLIGYPFLFLYFFLLYTLNRLGTPLYILAIANALQVALYWFPLHIWLANTSHKGAVGNDLGKFFAASQFVGLFAPVIAAFVISFFGFKYLFLLTAAIYLVSVIPVLYLPEFPFKEKIHVRRFFQLLRKYPRYIAAEIFENIREDAEGVIWPIFIYLAFRNILAIGYIGALSGVGAILFNLLVGKYTDKIDKRKLLGAGALIMVLIWILRFFPATQLIAYGLTLASAFFGILIIIPINTMVYNIAKREGAPTFIIFREFGVAIGRIALYVFAFFVIKSMDYIFIFAALACLGLLYLSKKNIELKTVV
jgi:MFS family permease